MNAKALVLLLVALLGMSGCILTKEGFVAKLNSDDPKERKWAEDVVVRGATDKSMHVVVLGITDGKEGREEQLKWVEYASNNESLFRILEQASDFAVMDLAASKIDFNKEGAKEKFEEWCFKEHNYRCIANIKNYLQYLSIDALADSEFQSYMEMEQRGRGRELCYWYIGNKLTDPVQLSKYFDQYQYDKPEHEALMAGFIEKNGVERIEDPERLKWLLGIIDNNTLPLYDIFNNIEREKISKLSASSAEAEINLDKEKHAALETIENLPPSKRGKEREKIEAQFSAKKAEIKSTIESAKKEARERVEKRCKEAVAVLAAKLSDKEKVRMEIVSRRLNCEAQDYRMLIALTIKDEASKESVYCKMLEDIEDLHLYGYDAEGQKEYWLAESNKLKETITSAGIARILIAKPEYYAYLSDRVTPEVALAVLKTKKMKSRDVEIELCKKIPDNKITLELVSCIQSAEGKNILKKAIPNELKEQLAKNSKAQFDEVMKKAKEAAQTTFMLGGFYLGMNQDDLKVVFAYYFPDYELDCKKAKNNIKIYVSSQETPFAKVNSSGKVIEFTFGKKILKKWYNYDVQNYEEWIHAYGEEHNARFIFKLRKLDNNAYYFHQDSWQYTNNTKDYCLTYFGDWKNKNLSLGSGFGDLSSDIGAFLALEHAEEQLKGFHRDAGSLGVSYKED